MDDAQRHNQSAADQVLHIDGATIEVIGAIPGTSAQKQTINAYIIAGLSQLIATGDAAFTDKAARAICQAAGCYDATNHSKRLNEKGNDIAGSKDRGWTLTAPGLKKAAALVKEIAPN